MPCHPLKDDHHTTTGSDDEAPVILEPITPDLYTSAPDYKVKTSFSAPKPPLRYPHESSWDLERFTRSSVAQSFFVRVTVKQPIQA